jgi:uncharacterized coiled-coil protein SlyX
MVIPWLLFVASAASIIESATGLVKTARQMLGKSNEASSHAAQDLNARVVALEDTERRQAEVVSDIAQQLGQHAEALSALHAQVDAQSASLAALNRQTRMLAIGFGCALLLAVSALVVALMRG